MIKMRALLPLLLLFAKVSFCQSIDQLQQSKRDKLLNIIKLQDSIKIIDNQIEDAMKVAIYKVNKSPIIQVTIKENDPIKLLPDVTSKNIGFTNKGDTISVYSKIFPSDMNSLYLKSADTGFVNLKFLNKSDELLAIIKVYENEKDSIERFQNLTNQKEYEKKKANLEKIYGVSNAKRILERAIWIGMTANMAVQSWGRPQKTNTIAGTFGKHEQWIYPNNVFLYFDNDILTAWQD